MSYVRDLTTPINQALLAENMNLGIVLPIESRGDIRVEVFLFRVVRAYPLVKVLSTKLPTISPGGIVDFNYVGSAGLGSGDDVFEIPEEYPWRIYHFGMGIKPSWIKLYRAVPSGYVAMGWARKVPTKVGDEYDYVDGSLSPFEEPTVSSESVVFKKLSFTIGLKNDSAVATRPLIRILGKSYEVTPITSKKLIDLIISGKIPCRLITVGGLVRFPYCYPPEWTGKSVVFGVNEFQNILQNIWG